MPTLLAWGSGRHGLGPIDYGISWTHTEIAVLVPGSIVTNSAAIYEQIIHAKECHIVMTE